MSHNKDRDQIVSFECDMQVPDFCITDNNIVRTQILRRLFELSKDREIRLLDVGCGTAWMWKEFLEAVPNVIFYGFDPNPRSVAKAQQNLSGFSDNIHCADIRQMSSIFPQKFDVIVSHSVLEHVYPREEFISNICSSLKNDGLLLLTYGSDHFRQSIRTDFRNFCSRLLAFIGVERYYAKEVTDNSVLNLLTKYRMEIIKRRYFSLVPVKKAGKVIHDLSERQKFCLLWYMLEENLNQCSGDQKLLQPMMDETYLEIIHNL